MSSISGIGQSSFQYLQSVKSRRKASQAAPGSTTAAVQDSDGDSDGSSPEGSLFQQIHSAVTSGLQSAQSSGATADPNKVIQNAIAQIFKNQQNIKSGNSSQTTVSGSDPDGDGDTDTPGVTTSDASSTQSAFTQLLQSNGVDAQQFQQDFLSAIQTAQSGGSSKAGNVFSSFPPGSLVDTLA